jgi:hypothetical protein
METLSITLGGQTYSINKLTIGQQMALGIGVALPESPDPQDNIRRAFERNLNIIVAALSKNHPTMTREWLLENCTATGEERREAVDKILDFAGLIRAEPKPGETAGAPAASNGASLSGASPQP